MSQDGRFDFGCELLLFRLRISKPGIRRFSLSSLQLSEPRLGRDDRDDGVLEAGNDFLMTLFLLFSAFSAVDGFFAGSGIVGVLLPALGGLVDLTYVELRTKGDGAGGEGDSVLLVDEI